MFHKFTAVNIKLFGVVNSLETICVFKTAKTKKTTKQNTHTKPDRKSVNCSKGASKRSQWKCFFVWI